jgi:virginiamycin A acetyltransferase
MKKLIGLAFNTVYFLYTFFPVYIIVNFFLYFGKNISLKSFILTRNIGKGARIMGGVFISPDSFIGDFTYISGDEFGLNCSKILQCRIGKYCSVGQNFITLPTGHNFHAVSTYPFLSLAGLGDDAIHKPIIIGSDVWIGSNVIVLGGVTIHDGAVIGAGAIVTRDVPAYSIAVGNPAKVIKKRFSNDEIELLLKTKWWDKDPDKIKKIMYEYNHETSPKEFTNKINLL